MKRSNQTYSLSTYSLTLSAEGLEFGDFCDGLERGVGQMRRVQEGEGAKRGTPGDQTLWRKSRPELLATGLQGTTTALFHLTAIDCVLRLEYQHEALVCSVRL